RPGSTPRVDERDCFTTKTEGCDIYEISRPFSTLRVTKHYDGHIDAPGMIAHERLDRLRFRLQTERTPKIGPGPARNEAHRGIRIDHLTRFVEVACDYLVERPISANRDDSSCSLAQRVAGHQGCLPGPGGTVF